MHESMPASSAEELTAAIINTAVENTNNTSYRELAKNVEDIATQSGTETPEIAAYISTLRSFSHDASIGALPEGVGGQFDGSITIARSTVEVGSGGVGQTIAQMQEVNDHELYHALNHHTDAMMTMGSAPTVIIAGEGFSTTAVVEGLVVTKTGEDFVSDEYRGYKSRLLASIAKADLSLDQVENAVNVTKDLTSIDDRKSASVVAMAA